jgi:hypothetical protein
MIGIPVLFESAAADGAADLITKHETGHINKHDR